MIAFFRTPSQSIIAVETIVALSEETSHKLRWLFGNAAPITEATVQDKFIGPRREMITPWSTCAVEITQNMGIEGITRIEEYYPAGKDGEATHDPMLQRVYNTLNQ